MHDNIYSIYLNCLNDILNLYFRSSTNVEEEENEITEGDEPEPQSSSSGETPTPVSKPSSFRRKKSTHAELEESYLQYIKEKRESLERSETTTKEEEADRHWLLSLLPSLTKLPEQEKALMKLRIQELFVRKLPTLAHVPTVAPWPFQHDGNVAGPSFATNINLPMPTPSQSVSNCPVLFDNESIHELSFAQL